MRDRDTLRRLTIQRAMFRRHAELVREQAGAARALDLPEAQEYAETDKRITQHIVECAEDDIMRHKIGDRSVSKLTM